MTMVRQWWDVVADAFDPDLRLRDDDPTPGHLAQRLDPAIVQTPALDIIDRELVQIRDAIAVMFARRARFAELVREGVSQETATERAAAEIASAGNDRLIVSMPPQEGKSSRITRYGVLWLLRQFPTLRVGIVSYDGDNAGQFSYLVRADIELFNGTSNNLDLGLRLVTGQKAMTRWTLTTGGGVFAIGIGGGLAGRPLDYLVIDDPIKDIRNADSILLSSQAWEWWQTVARPRLAPWAPVIQVSTRWHEADLAGRMNAKQQEDESAGVEHFDRWRIVNIPAQAEDEDDILGRQPGEFMVSARGRTVAQWEATKAATAPRFWTALFQGKPSPDVGDIWLREWWRRYDTVLWTQAADGSYRLDGYDVTQSWDCAFRETKSSDFVVGQVWAKKGADSFLVYQVWARLSFTNTIEAIRRVTRLFPQSRRKIIEAKANGDAVIDSLQHEIAGIIKAEPTQSKVARATAVSPFIRAGNVHLPTTRVATTEREIAFDVEAFIQQATSFPNAANDDAVDAASQYLNEAYLAGGGVTIIVPIGRIPLSSVRRQGQQALAPFQKRLNDRYLRRGQQAVVPVQQRLTHRLGGR
jgi:predicted phage terminase large subunit-like protein